MPKRANLYIVAVAIAGFAIFGWASLRWQTSDVRQYATYLLLALLASALKLRLPGLRGTISANFLFILIGVAG